MTYDISPEKKNALHMKLILVDKYQNKMKITAIQQQRSICRRSKGRRVCIFKI